MSNKNDWANVPDPPDPEDLDHAIWGHDEEPGIIVNGGFWPLRREDITASAAVNEKDPVWTILEQAAAQEPKTVPEDRPIMIHDEYSPVVGAVLLNLARAGMLTNKHWEHMFLSRDEQIRTDYANYEENH